MKALRVAVLSILLIFQTVLNPIADFSEATSLGTEQSAFNVSDDVSSEDVTSSEQKEQQQNEELNSEESDQETSQQDDEKEAVVQEDSKQDDVQKSEEPKTEEKLKEENEKVKKSSVALFNTESIEPVLDREDEDLTFNEKLTIGGVEVPKGSNPTASAKVGDTVKYEVKIEFKAGHKYGDGSKYEYELPSLFANLNISPTDIYEGSKHLATVSKSGQKITIEFKNGIRDEVGGGTFADVFFTVQGTLQYGGDDWSQEITVPGYEKITLNFKPDTSKGSKITKKGTADNNGQKSQYIEWEVDVNTNLGVNSNSGTTQFKDVLTGEHTFEPGALVSIHELNIAPNGDVEVGANVTASITPNISGDKKTLTINLPNKEHTGYRIVYKTKIGDPGDEETAQFKNNATYNGGGSTVTKTVNFGTPLEKTSTSGPNVNDLTTEWTIKYNHNKRTIPESEAKLTDTWSAGHELVGGIEVKTAEGDSVLPSLYTITLNANGFELKFNQDVTEGYTIKYKTKLDGNTYPSSDKTITNTVTRQDNGKSASASATYSTSSFVLHKKASGVDYKEKTMSWTITANQAGYPLKSGTKFVDTYNEPIMKVIEPLTVTVGGQPFSDFTFEKTYNGDGKEIGFTITLDQDVSEEIVITYDTEYDIKDVGTNSRTFKNTVTLQDTGIPNFGTATKSATQTVKTEQLNNGSKTGVYNYETKTFEWEVLLNFNYNSFTNAIFKDTLPASQKVTSMKVEEGELNPSGDFVPSSSTDVHVTGFGNTIDYSLGNIDKPYRITYTSVDADGVYPHGNGKIKINNKAELYDGSNLNAEWDKEVTIEHTDKILVKNMTQEGTTAKVNWNFKFNYAQSDLRNIVITDTVGKLNDGSPSQLILKDSFKVWEMNFSGTNSTPTKGAQVPLDDDKLIVDIANGTFTLKLPDGDKAYYVEYSTIYMGPSPGDLENTVEATYESKDGNSGFDEYKIANFSYSGGGSTTTVPFVVVKTNAVTGQPMENVKFDLYGPYTGSTLLLSGTTNEDGVLDFGVKFAPSSDSSKKYKLVEEKQNGYQALTYEFVLDSSKVQVSGPYAGKQVVEIANEPEKAPACSKFELTVKDIDGDPLSNGQQVTLKNKNTDIETQFTVGNNGKIKFKRNSSISGSEPVLTAGEYEVYYNGEKLDDITVEYDGDCSTTAQPKPSCQNFTIQLKDEEGNVRSNVEVTLKAKDGTEITTATTDGDGKFTIPSTTPAGKYDLYEDKLYLKEVTVTYKGDCTTEVIQAPKCPSFTLTSVYDVDGNKLGEGVEITLKNNGTEVAKEKIDADGKVTFTNLPSGTYEVFNGTEKLGEVTTNTNCEIVFAPKPSCPNFTIELQDENGNPRGNVEVTVKAKDGTEIGTFTTDQDGKLKIPSTTPAGQYELYEGKQYLQDVTITYKNGCETTVIQAPKCPNFTLTITHDVNGNAIKEGTKITLKNKETGKEVSSKTNKNGKVTFANLANGTYEVYQGKVKLGEIETNTSCETVLQPKPSCPAFTITLKDKDGSARPNVKVTVKDSKGKVIVKDVATNKDGSINIKINILPAGEYTLYENTLYLGTIKVDYKNPCNVELTYKPVCKNCTIVITDENGNPRPDVNIIIKEYDDGVEGDVIATGKTDKNGKIKLDEIPAGDYIVYETDENGKIIKKLGYIDVDNDSTEFVENIDDDTNTDNNTSEESPEEDPTEDNNNKESTSDSDESVQDSEQRKLPQTNGETKVVPVIIGFLLVAISSLLLFRRKKVGVK